MYKEKELINNQYEVHRCLIGGMAYVYIVVDQVTDRQYAIKMPKPECLADPETAKRFEREARTWINLGDQENIVRAIACFRSKEPLLVLEFIDGLSLDRLIRAEPGGLELGQTLRLAVQIARGLHYAHGCEMPGGLRGVVHRDLKPSNIMITKKCTAKLTDFGLARAHDESDLTSMNRLMGTLPYMPPEQFVDAHTVTEKADIYSLGVVYYQMVTANLPFPRATLPEMFNQVRNNEPEPIATYREGVEPALVQLIMECLEKKPENRPETALLLAERLEDMRAKLEPPDTTLRPCRSCGYVANKPHLKCPVCEAAAEQQQATTEPSIWRCPSCGNENPTTFRFCTSCRCWICKGCYHTNPTSFAYCSHCGTPQLGGENVA